MTPAAATGAAGRPEMPAASGEAVALAAAATGAAVALAAAAGARGVAARPDSARR